MATKTTTAALQAEVAELRTQLSELATLLAHQLQQAPKAAPATAAAPVEAVDPDGYYVIGWFSEGRKRQKRRFEYASEAEAMSKAEAAPSHYDVYVYQGKRRLARRYKGSWDYAQADAWAAPQEQQTL